MLGGQADAVFFFVPTGCPGMERPIALQPGNEEAPTQLRAPIQERANIRESLCGVRPVLRNGNLPPLAGRGELAFLECAHTQKVRNKKLPTVCPERNERALP